MPTITIALPAYVTELQAEPFPASATAEVAQTVTLTGGAGSIVVAATGGAWCWRFTECGPGYRKTRFCAVSGNVAYSSLVDLDPGTLVAAVEPADSAWEAGVTTAVNVSAAAVASVGRIRIDASSSAYASHVAAVAAAPAGSIITFPPGVYVNPTGAGNGVTVQADNVTLEFSAGAEIQVNTWGQAGIDCIGRSGAKVLGGLVRYTGARVPGGGISYRGSIQTSGTAGVYITRDRCVVDGLRTINMPVGVYLSSWDGVTSRDRKGVSNAVRNIETEGMDFGVLWSGQKALRITNIYGHDDIDDSLGVNPTHVIYCAADASFTSEDVVVSDCVGANILNGHAYQVKFTSNAQLRNLVARDSAGLMSLLGCTDVEWNGWLVGAKETTISPQGWVIIQDFASARIEGVATIVADAVGADHRAVHMAANDSKLSVTLVTRRKSSAAASVAEVRVLGVGNRVSVDVKNLSAFPAPAVQVGDTTNDSTGTRVAVGRVSGCSRLVDFYNTGGGTVSYVPEHVSLTTSTFVSAQGGSPTYRTIVS